MELKMSSTGLDTVQEIAQSMPCGQKGKKLCWICRLEWGEARRILFSSFWRGVEGLQTTVEKEPKRNPLRRMDLDCVHREHEMATWRNGELFP